MLRTRPDAKYDVAITTACNLNQYVVDTTSDAEACVRFLRDNNLGRASFVILVRASLWQMRGLGLVT